MINGQSSYTPTTFANLGTRINRGRILQIESYENLTTLSTFENSFSSEHKHNVNELSLRFTFS